MITDNAIPQDEDQVIRASFYLQTDYIELVHNAVYTKKIGGQVNCTQQDILEEALDLYRQKHSIIERPLEVKLSQEKKRKKLQKKEKNQTKE